MCRLSCFFFFKQKTAYEMRISDWSSDVCSSDLEAAAPERLLGGVAPPQGEHHRQGDLAIAEIVPDRLAQLGLQGGVVEHVVDELEGDAEAAAEAFQRGLLDGRASGHHRADAAGGGEQRGSLGF